MQLDGEVIKEEGEKGTSLSFGKSQAKLQVRPA